MGKLKFTTVLFLLVVLLSATAVTACGKEEAPPSKEYKEITFGFISCMTGPTAWLHPLWADTAQMAVDEINAAGGVDGVPLKMVFGDHQSGDAEAGVTAYHMLRDIHHVEFIINTFSPPNLAVQPLAAEDKVLALNPSGWSPELVGKDYLFHSRLMGNVLGLGAAKVAWDKGYRKAAILYPNDKSGIGMTAYVEPIWKQWGGTVVAKETAELGTKDFKVQLTKIKAANPEVIMDWFYSTDLGYSIKQARELGMEQPFVGLIWQRAIQEAAGEASEGFSYVEDLWDAEGDDPWTRRFVEAYRATHGGENPIVYDARTYELVYLLRDLILWSKENKGGDYYKGENLREALTAIKTFPSVYGGTMTFRDDGTCTKKMAHYAVHAGKAEVVREVTLD